MKMREKTMKRMIGVSIAAMLAAVPMLANAEPVAGISISDGDKGVISSKAYVKGAYNAAIGAVNAVDAAVSTRQAQLVNDAETPASVGSIVKTAVADAGNARDDALVTEAAVRNAIDTAVEGVTPNQDLSAAAGDALTWNGTTSKLNVNLTADGGLQTTAGANEGDPSSLGVKLDGNTLTSGANGLAVNLGNGLATDANGAIIADVDGSTIEIDSTNGLQVKDGGIAFNKLNNAAVKTTVADANNASNSVLVTEAAVRNAIDTAVEGVTPNQDLSAAAGDALTWNGTTSKLNVNLTADGGLQTTAGANEGDPSSLGVKLDGNTLTSGANGLAVNVSDGLVSGASGLAVNLGNGLATDANGAIIADVDDSTIEIDSNNGKLQIKDSGVAFAKLNSSDIKTTVAAAGSASNSALVTEAAVRGAIDTRQAQLVNDAETPANMDSTVKTTVADANNASNSALVTEAAVRSAVDAVANAAGQNLSAAAGDALAWNGTTSKLDVNLTTNGGLQTIAGANANDPSSLSVKVDGSTIEIDSNNGQLQIKDGGVAFAKLNSSDVKTTVAAAGSASNSALVTEAAVRGAIDAATTTAGMATQTGVSETIAATTITVPVYTTWGSTTTTQNVTATVTKPTYTTGTPPA